MYFVKYIGLIPFSTRRGRLTFGRSQPAQAWRHSATEGLLTLCFAERSIKLQVNKRVAVGVRRASDASQFRTPSKGSRVRWGARGSQPEDYRHGERNSPGSGKRADASHIPNPVATSIEEGGTHPGLRRE